MSYAYHDGIKEGFITLLEHLLPKLPYRSLGEAIWAMGELPLVDEKRAVDWILEYCSPTQVCFESIDTDCPQLVEYYEQYSDIQEGEVIVLVAQRSPKQNGVYVYTGDSTPLMR